MFGKLFAVMAVLALGMTAANAQSCEDIITKRQNLMKVSGAAGKTAGAMMKGETPFDLDKAKEVFAAWADDAKEMPTMFPDCSKTGAHTTAAPAIWDKPDDFKALIAKFTADVKAAQDSTKDLDTFKANVATVGKNCSNCHQAFRVRPS